MNLKRNALRGAVTAVLLAVGATAFAGVNVDIGIAVPGIFYPQPVPVYAPAPVYVVPQPYYAPAPVYAMPRPVYAPRWRGDDHRGHGDDDDDRGKRKWRGRDHDKHGHHDKHDKHDKHRDHDD